jgi:hypothetical protein
MLAFGDLDKGMNEFGTVDGLRGVNEDPRQQAKLGNVQRKSIVFILDLESIFLKEKVGIELFFPLLVVLQFILQLLERFATSLLLPNIIIRQLLERLLDAAYLVVVSKRLLRMTLHLHRHEDVIQAEQPEYGE